MWPPCPRPVRSGARFAPLLLLALLVPSRAGARPSLAPGETFERLPRPVYARFDPYRMVHDVGLLRLQLTNLGIIGNPYSDESSAAWRNGEYLFGAGLWIGAVGEDQEAHVSSSIFRREEWRPTLRPEDHIYESYEGTRGGLRLGDVSDGNDDGDGAVDEDFQNGRDDDGDGLIDEDFHAVGQQMFSCEYRDDSPEAVNQLSDHRPLGLLVRQRSFQWSTPGSNEFVGFDFEIVNVGDQRLRDVYVGFNVDADAGPPDTPFFFSDDYVGFARLDTTVTAPASSGPCARRDLSIDVAYIWDAPDNGTTINGGDVPGWFGGMFLGHTTDPAGVKAPFRVGLTTVRWTASQAPYPAGDPITDVERYDLLSRGGLPNRPVNRPDDYRFTLAGGPFRQLDPGDRLNLQVAFVVGEGRQGMINNAVGAQRIFNGQYTDADHDPSTGVDGAERCLRVLEPGQEVIWDDPCDTLETRLILNRVGPCYYVDDDCNVCTGLDGRETLVNWVGTTAPPPGDINTDPDLQAAIPGPELYLRPPGGDRRILLQWDNGAELHRDPQTGAEFFEGYRIWRVDGWQRPEGSIGPAPDEWMLMAEYRRHPRQPVPSGEDLREDDMRRIRRPGNDAVKQMTPDGPLYYVGRYEWEDTRGIVNGRVYFYAVTAFGYKTQINGDTGQPESIELSSSPAATQKEMVMASWPAGEGCDQLRVVPNPYRGGADWDLHPSGCDPTGTRVAFRNLPSGWERLDIFSLTGDLILSAGPGDSRVLGGCEVGRANRQAGTFYWDLVSRSGQNVVSGVYLYALQHPAGNCRGRFVIIR